MHSEYEKKTAKSDSNLTTKSASNGSWAVPGGMLGTGLEHSSKSTKYELESSYGDQVHEHFSFWKTAKLPWECKEGGPMRGILTERYWKLTRQVWEKYAKKGPNMSHLRPFRTFGSIGNEFAASISSSLSPSRPPWASKIAKITVKNIVGRSFLDSSSFPYKID